MDQIYVADLLQTAREDLKVQVAKVCNARRAEGFRLVAIQDVVGSSGGLLFVFERRLPE